MKRTEPTIGSLDNLFNDQTLYSTANQVEALAAAHLDSQAERLREAQQSGQTDRIVAAESAYESAAQTSKAALESLSRMIEARVKLMEGQKDYLQNRPDRGALMFDRASQMFRQAGKNLAEVGYSMSDWPDAAWQAVTAKVTNTVSDALHVVGESVADRKERITGWFRRVGQQIEAFADRVQALPERIQNYMDTKVANARTAALNVILPVLNWGVTQEERLRAKARNVADVTEAVTQTAMDAGRVTRRVLGQALGGLRSNFNEHLSSAREKNDSNRRGP